MFLNSSITIHSAKPTLVCMQLQKFLSPFITTNFQLINVNEYCENLKAKNLKQ